MADTLIREGNPPAGKLASPTPLYDLTADGQGGKERVLGSHGAPRAQLYDTNGNPIDASNPLEARARQLETLLGALTDELVAAGAGGSVSAKLRRLTTDLGAILTRLGEAQDTPSAYTVLGRLKALESALAAVQVRQDAQHGILATDAELSAARLLLASLEGEDFATQTTLEALATELAAVKAELETIKAAQIDGTAKVTLSGTLGSDVQATKSSPLLAANETRTLVTVNEACTIETLALTLPNTAKEAIRLYVDRISKSGGKVAVVNFYSNYASSSTQTFIRPHFLEALGRFAGFEAGPAAESGGTTVKLMEEIKCPYGFEVRIANVDTENQITCRFAMSYRVGM